MSYEIENSSISYMKMVATINTSTIPQSHEQYFDLEAE